MDALLIVQDANEEAILSQVIRQAGLAIVVKRQLKPTLANLSELPISLLLIATCMDDPTSTIRRVRDLSQVPAVIIADLLTEESTVALLTGGADLVLSRPYSARLLVGQLKALLRRASSHPTSPPVLLCQGGLTLAPDSHMVQAEGESAQQLTRQEFQLLHSLMLHQGQTLSTQTIIEQVWGYTGEGDESLLRKLVSRLRAKVEPDPSSPRYIVTVRGVGYRFME